MNLIPEYTLQSAGSEDWRQPSFVDDNGDGFISLEEIARQHPYRVEYLLAALQQRQLKGFKMGQHWLTTPQWLHEYHQKLANQIDQEITTYQQAHTDSADRSPAALAGRGGVRSAGRRSRWWQRRSKRMVGSG